MFPIFSISLLVCGFNMTAPYLRTAMRLSCTLRGHYFLLFSCINDKHKANVCPMIYVMFFSNGHQTGECRVPIHVKQVRNDVRAINEAKQEQQRKKTTSKQTNKKQHKNKTKTKQNKRNSKAKQNKIVNSFQNRKQDSHIICRSFQQELLLCYHFLS